MADDNTRRIRAKRSREFFVIEKQLIRQYGRIIGPHGIALYNSLSSYANPADADVWPKVSTICAEISISESTARRSIEMLERLGIIRVCETFTDKGQDSSVYELLDLPKTINPDWQSGPRPARDVLDLRSDKSKPLPKPATIRNPTRVSEGHPPGCQAETPQVSAGPPPGVRLTDQRTRIRRTTKSEGLTVQHVQKTSQENAHSGSGKEASPIRKFAELRAIAESGQPIPDALMPSALERARLEKWASGKSASTARWAQAIIDHIERQPR